MEVLFSRYCARTITPTLCPPFTESPFARSGRYPLRCDLVDHMGRNYPSAVTTSSSCARPKSSLSLGFPLVPKVFAGYSESLLEVGPSRRCLCDPCIGAWVLTPPRLCGAIIRFFPLEHRPPLRSKRIGSWELSHKQLHMRRCSRGCNHSLIFRLPYSLGPPAVLTIRELCPSGHRALYTGQYLCRYRSQAPASLSVRTGQLTRQDL